VKIARSFDLGNAFMRPNLVLAWRQDAVHHHYVNALRPPAPKKYSALEAHNAQLEAIISGIEHGLALAPGSLVTPQQAALICARFARESGVA